MSIVRIGGNAATASRQSLDHKRRFQSDGGRLGRVSFDTIGPMTSTGRRRFSRLKSVVEQFFYEPTYRMEPKVKFNRERAERVVRSIVDRRMAEEFGTPYRDSAAGKLATSMADEIRAAVRDLAYERYRLVVVVDVGEVLAGGTDDGSASVICASRCLWDAQTDSFVEAVASTSQLYAVAVVFALYAE